jgi:hypothetical protein
VLAGVVEVEADEVEPPPAEPDGLAVIRGEVHADPVLVLDDVPVDVPLPPDFEPVTPEFGVDRVSEVDRGLL